MWGKGLLIRLAIFLVVFTSVKHFFSRHTGPLRVVHLDLKGIAPKVNYFQQFFPLISTLEANGILLEYADMFPYEGDLEVLRSPNAFSVEEIDEINWLANLYNLELIPLVQVSGNLEFVLKHEQFSDLRWELSNLPNSLDTLAPGSLKLIKEMLTQVLKRHPYARMIHIGGHEVLDFGVSENSNNTLKQKIQDTSIVLVKYVTKVCEFLVTLKPEIKPIFWEDILRSMSIDLIKEFDLSRFALPMIWKYDSNISVYKMEKLLQNYQEAGFNTVWCASAFKGISGINHRWIPISYHLENQLAWLKVMDSISKNKFIHVGGIVLTGWQRFDQHTTLQLFPSTIPSLATCLATLKYGSFNLTTKIHLKSILGCSINLSINLCLGNGIFVGSEIYYIVHKILSKLQPSIKSIIQKYNVEESLSEGKSKYQLSNPANIKNLKGELTGLLKFWDQCISLFQMEMLVFYFPDTVDAWMEENVNQHMNVLHSLQEMANLL